VKRTRTNAATGGRFDVILENDRAQAATMTLGPGRSTGGPTNAHAESDQWLYVVSGTGRATVEGRDVDLAAGDLLLVEAGETHEIACTGESPLETLNLYVPPEY
jgi:mannose-6-phosphate isomerase-like protein (cupin superfamily)